MKLKPYLRKSLNLIPAKPGVYVFLDSQKHPLYVGKARNLRRRVLSYFREIDLDQRIKRLAERVNTVKTYVVGREVEALLLEADLIKRWQPSFNVRRKDDRGYQFIRITREDYPRLEKVSFAARRERLFGPYPLGNVVLILKALRKVFPFRDCGKSKWQHYQKLKRPCLYGNLRLCPAPCTGKISVPVYQQHVKNIAGFLRGKKKKVLFRLKKEMREEAKKQNFEKAAFFRDQWRRLAFLEQARYPKDWEDSLSEFSLKDGERGIEGRAEAYDISHFTGKAAVGSMVVFVNRSPAKGAYRRFKIKSQKTLDDYAMLQEVLRRRLTNKALGKFPDLILIDGGPGQLSTALKVQADLGLQIPTYALAKRKEEVYASNKEEGSKITRLFLPPTSPLLHFFQRLRDEAHRFALAYHRHARKAF